MKKDLYLEVSSSIIAMIEANPGGWLKPWTVKGGNGAAAIGAMPCNGTTGKTYRGINILLLWDSAKRQGFTSAQWASFNQWKAKGGIVRKGEKGSLIIFYKSLTVDDRAKPGEKTTIPMLRCYHVFNRDQVEGLAPEVSKPVLVESPAAVQMARIAAVDAFVKATGATVHHGGNRAFYTTGGDFIQMPNPEDFHGTPTSTAQEAYYSTLLHEAGHWTGHASRCNREFGARFGDKAYAFEELVAELAAAFMCAELGISSEPRADHAQYLASWLRVLKDDRKAIFTAATKAAQACDYLKGKQAAEEEEEAAAIAA